MLTQQAVDQFQRDGFLNGGRVLDDAQVAELIAELDRVITTGPQGFQNSPRKPVLFRDINNLGGKGPYGENPGASTTPVWQIVNIWEVSDAFERLIYLPQIVAGISQLTGMLDLMVWHDQVQYKPALAGGATAWHQDAPLWPSIMPMTPVSAWIPLDDADIENGCMWMVPGSHLWGNQIQYLHSKPYRSLPEFASIGDGFAPPAEAPIKQARAVPWPVKRGELSFHHSLTWHGSPTNTSPRPRRAIAIHYMTGEAQFVGKRGHPMEQFINLPAGAPMAEAGEHFPRVCRGGQPTGGRAKMDAASARP